jgi:hypothetical protein
LRVIAIEDWAEIRRLHRSEGVPIKEIARRPGVLKYTPWSSAISANYTASPRARRGGRGQRGAPASGMNGRESANTREIHAALDQAIREP